MGQAIFVVGYELILVAEVQVVAEPLLEMAWFLDGIPLLGSRILALFAKAVGMLRIGCYRVLLIIFTFRCYRDRE